jgi:hypothetical protein
MWSVEKRLASAERELRLQFTRIAQLQAELDLLVGALRRLPDAVQREQGSLGAAVMRASDQSRHNAEEGVVGDSVTLISHRRKPSCEGSSRASDDTHQLKRSPR